MTDNPILKITVKKGFPGLGEILRDQEAPVVEDKRREILEKGELPKGWWHGDRVIATHS